MTNLFTKIMLVAAAIALFSFSTEHPESDAKALALIKAMYKVNGGWEKLASKNDVEFTYVYNSNGKMDISTERYIFDNEASWAKYSRHEVNVMPEEKGTVKQCLMDGNPMISLNGEAVADPQALGGTAFLRSANYFWFTMMYKLDDPGTINKYLGKETINGINYEKVSLSYESAVVGKEVNDEYILYFNPKTKLVDIFMFSLPIMGFNEPVLKMEVEYSVIDGISVQTKRVASFPDEDGNYAPSLEQTTKDVKFNNKFTSSDFHI